MLHSVGLKWWKCVLTIFCLWSSSPKLISVNLYNLFSYNLFLFLNLQVFQTLHVFCLLESSDPIQRQLSGSLTTAAYDGSAYPWVELGAGPHPDRPCKWPVRGQENGWLLLLLIKGSHMEGNFSTWEKPGYKFLHLWKMTLGFSFLRHKMGIKYFLGLWVM